MRPSMIGMVGLNPGAVFGVALVGLLCACGSSGEASCTRQNGIICTDCASSDCEITCADDEYEYCVGLTYFGDENPDDLRCAYCDNE